MGKASVKAREAERIRNKRQDAAYLAAERVRQRDRMRKRRKRPAQKPPRPEKTCAPGGVSRRPMLVQP
jgi:hypothetical protein